MSVICQTCWVTVIAWPHTVRAAHFSLSCGLLAGVVYGTLQQCGASWSQSSVRMADVRGALLNPGGGGWGGGGGGKGA